LTKTRTCTLRAASARLRNARRNTANALRGPFLALHFVNAATVRTRWRTSTKDVGAMKELTRLVKGNIIKTKGLPARWKTRTLHQMKKAITKIMASKKANKIKT